MTNDATNPTVTETDRAKRESVTRKRAAFQQWIRDPDAYRFDDEYIDNYGVIVDGLVKGDNLAVEEGE